MDTVEKTLEPATRDLDRDLRARGVGILTIFALIWSAVAASGLSEVASVAAGAWPSMIVAVLIAVTVVAVAHRSRRSPRLERTRNLPSWWSRGVAIVNIIQLVAIFATIAALNASSHSVWIPPVVVAIIGLHFLPLATAFDQWQYRWTAALLVVVAAIGAVLVVAKIEPVVVQATVGYLSAGVLLATAWNVGSHG